MRDFSSCSFTSENKRTRKKKYGRGQTVNLRGVTGTKKKTVEEGEKEEKEKEEEEKGEEAIIPPHFLSPFRSRPTHVFPYFFSILGGGGKQQLLLHLRERE